jgi:hypothetical protein
MEERERCYSFIMSRTPHEKIRPHERLQDYHLILQNKKIPPITFKTYQNFYLPVNRVIVFDCFSFIRENKQYLRTLSLYRNNGNRLGTVRLASLSANDNNTLK